MNFFNNLAHGMWGCVGAVGVMVWLDVKPDIAYVIVYVVCGLACSVMWAATKE
jgi:hypothetical protein